MWLDPHSATAERYREMRIVQPSVADIAVMFVLVMAERYREMRIAQLSVADIAVMFVLVMAQGYLETCFALL